MDPNLQVPPVKKSIPSILKWGGVELGLIISIVILILALNYFNIFSLSQLFPNIFGFLPHQSLVGSPNITPTPGFDRYNNSAKVKTATGVNGLRTEVNGTIIEIDTSRGVFENVEYALKIFLRTTQGEQRTLLFNDEEVGLIRVVQASGNSETPIRLTDLVTGDTVVIIITTDDVGEESPSHAHKLLEGKIVKK